VKTAYVVSGQVMPDGRLELDERLPVSAGPVRISVEPLDQLKQLSGQVEAPEAVAGSISDEKASEVPAIVEPEFGHERFKWPDAEELRRRKAIMDSCIGCLSDEEAARILKIVEEEFEQIDPDEWR
jgi:hypothetical protein